VTVLSEARSGWTPELQEKYFTWFSNAFLNHKGGVSFVGFIDRARKIALANRPKEKFAYFNKNSGDSLVTNNGRSLARAGIQPEGPGRNWKVEEALEVVVNNLAGRNFERGKAMYNASMCSSCHGMR